MIIATASLDKTCLTSAEFGIIPERVSNMDKVSMKDGAITPNYLPSSYTGYTYQCDPSGKYKINCTVIFTAQPPAPTPEPEEDPNEAPSQQNASFGVKNLKARLYEYDAVEVTWKKNNNITSFKVYQKKGKGKYKLVDTVTGYSYRSNKNLADGVQYTYKVVPYKGYDAGKAQTVKIYTLKKVTGVKVKKSGTKVKVSWKNINGETGYQISMHVKKGKTQVSPTMVSKATAKSVKLKAKKGTTYYYKVRAYKIWNGKKICGPWSAPIKYKR